ncbi:dipeptidase [Aneurinibacillus terranovensis]|uniref:dipeptidase n=1 Tax=Aneurinibacillus terranovensis TaxID=278991 RepID=UPI0004263CC1|nr:dipeptidase [Aneurinibacillus terranovensis]
MKIFDAHCDVLWKMWEASQKQLPLPSFYGDNEPELQVTFGQMEKADVKVQAFALYVPERVKGSKRFPAGLEMADIFYEQIIKNRQRIFPIRTRSDLALLREDGRKGALLTLEGAEALEGSLLNLRIFFQLGVRAIGLTWNFRNEAADGVGEENPGGLSQFGKQLVIEANRLGVMIDVSHLAEPGFWEVVRLNRGPFIASHSNCRAVCDHPRNVTDEQIKAIVTANGVIGLTFVAPFVSKKPNSTITDIKQHIDHLLELGAEDAIAFGSDFDGTDDVMEDLTKQEDYITLREYLLKNYSEERVEKWLWGNWTRVFSAVLPPR